MGMDVTYHPIDPEWAETAFLAPLAAAGPARARAARAAARRAGLGRDATDLYLRILSTAASWGDPSEPFEARLGPALCAAQSCFGPGSYTHLTLPTNSRV